MSEVDPMFEAGLYLSSASLYREYLKCISNPDAAHQKLARSMAKYRLRASTRATPFATFAGVSLAGVSRAPTSLVRDLPAWKDVRLRPDMEILVSFVNDLVRRPEIARQLRFQLNNSLYQVGDTYRYAEFRIENGLREYQLASLEQSPALAAIVQLAKAPIAFAELERVIQGLTGSGAAEILDYIGELIESQILVSELEPAVTGGDPLAQLLLQLSGVRGLEPEKALLRQLQDLLHQGDAGVMALAAAGDILRSLAGAHVPSERLLQADLFPASLSANLNQGVVDGILEQAAALMACAVAPHQYDLEHFKTRFRQRYEDRLVPLSLALDADLGIGYAGIGDAFPGSPLVDDLPFRQHEMQETYGMTPLRLLALRKYEGWRRDGRGVVELSDGDLDAVPHASLQTRRPESMYLMGSLLKSAIGLTDHDYYFDLSGIGGPSAANLLARFAYGDARIDQLCRELIDDEQTLYPDLVFAEIVHLPQSRTGNILLRPRFRAFEIPYIGVSGMPPEQQIVQDDLWIRLHADEIQLWSKRLDRRIVPRLTTAHNFSYNSLPVYRFLCDLQLQGASTLRFWDWGVLEEMQHLPRVVYKNLILRKARWTAHLADFDHVAIERSIESWKTRMGVPDRVVYVDGDNELLIDLTEAIGRELFMQYLNRHRNILLEEFLHNEETAVVHDRNGDAFANELIIPFTRNISGERSAGNSPFENHAAQRSFLPGSAWIYYKLYCGAATAEEILKTAVLPLVEDVLDRGLSGTFFFVRYRDDAAHIRLRFFAPDLGKRLQLQVSLNNCFAALFDAGLIYNVVSDTYTRELERYGGDTIGAAEQLFHNDSLAMLRIIDLLEGPSEDRYRTLLALRSVDVLLGDFELTLSEKHRLVKRLRELFFQEWGSRPALQKQLNESYRRQQRDIFLHLDAVNDDQTGIAEAAAVLSQRSARNAPVVAELRAIAPERLLERLPDFIHMSLNRLFVAKQRRYELVVYHFLEKYYASRMAMHSAVAEGADDAVL